VPGNTEYALCKVFLMYSHLLAAKAKWNKLTKSLSFNFTRKFDWNL